MSLNPNHPSIRQVVWWCYVVSHCCVFTDRMKRASVTWHQNSRDSWPWLRTCLIPLKRNRKILSWRMPRKRNEYWVDFCQFYFAASTLVVRSTHIFLWFDLVCIHSWNAWNKCFHIDMLHLTLWRPLLPWAWECPDVKITKDGLTRSGIGCFIAVPYGNSVRQRTAKVIMKIG